MNDRYFMNLAIEDARKSRDTDGYHVGAVIVKKGRVISRAHSDETKNNSHAEELALETASENIFGSTMYVTMEPCSLRPSGKFSCTDLIVASGIKRVVYGTKDPELKIPCRGIEILERMGVETTHLRELEKACKEISPTLF